MTQVKVVSYWAGEIPVNSELHFRSFAFNRGQNDTYKLYLDGNSEFNSSIPKNLSWLHDEPWFTFEIFNLEKLMQEKNLRLFSNWKANFIYRVVRRLKFKMLQFFCARITTLPLAVNRLSVIKNLSNRYNPSVGFAFNHSDSFSGLSHHLTYRADLFRTLVLADNEFSNLLYSDLDVCFLKPLKSLVSVNAYTSMWGTEDFANTCILFVPQGSDSIKSLVNELRLTSSAWPWTLYSKENCNKHGIEIKPLHLFDAIWDLKFSKPGRDASFFTDPEVTVEWIEWLNENSLTYHWHNNWTTPRHPDSVYETLLRKFVKGG